MPDGPDPQRSVDRTAARPPKSRPLLADVAGVPVSGRKARFALEQFRVVESRYKSLPLRLSFPIALRSASPKTCADSAYGQSLAYLRAGLVNDAAVSATKAKQNIARIVELQKAILSARAFNAGHSRETILYLDQLAQIEAERVDLMVLRAYAYKNLDRCVYAMRIFEALAATGNRDAIFGLGEMRAAGISPKK